MTRAIYAIATCDTKGHELQFVADRLRDLGVAVRTVDVGTLGPPQVVPDIPRHAILEIQDPSPATDRGQAVARMADALRDFLTAEHRADRLAGVLGLGGSGGTSLITTAMRALPVGLPKLMVSTVASGNIAPYIDCSDIMMMYSVVDIAGLNRVSIPILANAAHAIAGMATHDYQAPSSRPAVALTMFGVTTPCVSAAREALERLGFDVLVFHATGAGGRAMEQLVHSGLIQGVLDITTTEVADEVVGGVFPAGPHRFQKLLERGVPLVLSVGALDMVNFGAMDTVPPQFRNRRLHVHNAQVTLMRTTADENRAFGRWIADRLQSARVPITMLLPEGGVSALDAPGQPFFDPEADAALFEALESGLSGSPQATIRRLPHHINDPEFAAALVEAFLPYWHAQFPAP